jgi:hypothetical protein
MPIFPMSKWRCGLSYNFGGFWRKSGKCHLDADIFKFPGGFNIHGSDKRVFGNRTKEIGNMWLP